MAVSKYISRVLALLARGLQRASRAVDPTGSDSRVSSWFRDQGDKTLRLDYPLDADSLVFDLGGYEGQWASDIFARYRCTIHVFEPVQRFATRIERRFEKNDRIIVHRCGLSGETKKVPIALNEDSSSILKSGERTEEIQLLRAMDFIREHHILGLDLMKINIEGGEYDLLDHLIEADFIPSIGNLQVQFHDFVPQATERMARIQRKLAITHSLTYQYPFVWENWRKKDARERDVGR